MKTKAILFDFDGTLADTMDHHAKAWVRAFKFYGLNLGEKDVYKNEGSTEQMAEILLKCANHKFDNDLANKLAIKREEIFREIGKGELYPASFTLIEHVRSKGLKIAIVTGSSLEQLSQNSTPEFISMFDVIITCQDIKRGKPFPDPYLKAMERLEVKADECIVVENAPLGIKAAKAAGAKCVAICTTLPAKELTEADIIVRNHDDLFYILIRSR